MNRDNFTSVTRFVIKIKTKLYIKEYENNAAFEYTDKKRCFYGSSSSLALPLSFASHPHSLSKCDNIFKAYTEYFLK